MSDQVPVQVVFDKADHTRAKIAAAAQGITLREFIRLAAMVAVTRYEAQRRADEAAQEGKA